MASTRREFLRKAVAGGATAAVASGVASGVALPGSLAPAADAAAWKKRLTGADLDTFHRWRVAGTDLGIPYVLENGSIGYLFGDTFDTPFPEGPPLPNDWRSPVLLRSAVHPGDAQGIVFDSAAQVAGDGRTPEIMHRGHNGIGIDGIWEVTVIPNDAVGFPETGRQVVSYMSIRHWDSAGLVGPHWATNYAGLAYSDDGNTFHRTSVKWSNDDANTNPFQMWTMQRDGDLVYVFSVRAGRQYGPMVLQRVRWDQILDPGAYEGWGWDAGARNWAWGRPCTPILHGHFGEPSVRRLDDGTWVMAYMNGVTNCIVTRTAAGPDEPWSDERIQVGFWQEPSLYGGFIHPWSARGPGNLHLMVSKWQRDQDNRTTHYHVSQYVGTL